MERNELKEKIEKIILMTVKIDTADEASKQRKESCLDELALVCKSLEESDLQEDSTITLKRIVDAVASYYNLTLDQISSRNRDSSISWPRAIAMYLCQKMTAESPDAIGKYLGGRDVATVIHRANKVQDRYWKDVDFKTEVDTIAEKI